MTPEQQVLHEEGRAYFEQGDFDAAARCFSEIVKDGSDRFADVFNKLGIIYQRKGLSQKAAGFLEKALKINPSYTEAALNLSIVYNELGRYENAQKIFNSAVRTVYKTKKVKDPYIDGKLANEHACLGEQYYYLGRFKEAITEYRKALRLCPKYPDIITQLGLAYRENGEIEAAVETFTNAQNEGPKYVPAFLHLGITYYMKGFVDMAIREWNRALAIDPENQDAKIYLSFVSNAGI
ncbi:MAG: tetratricopeptide repeat protein [Nitrospira sp.]|nr:tetratricopeptide repeat protein [Nitrospira sp.]